MDLDECMDLQRGPRLHLIQWLQQRSLLANPLRCAQCNIDMELKERNAQHVDGFLWRCSGCRKKRSLRSNSFFDEFERVALGTLLLAIYYFVSDDSQKKTARRLRVSTGLISEIFKRLQDVCTRDLEERPIIPFGGPGVVVKCDESKFNHKAKNQKGRRPACETWVFGIVTTEFSPAKGYFQVVTRRNRATLDPIIAKCVRPGTTVFSDDWAAYTNMDRRINNVAEHRVVVHAHHFVDPLTGVHTQEIESSWNNLKLTQRKRRGIKREHLQSYLDERMWRQWRGEDPQRVMPNFLAALSLQYVTTNAAL